MRRRDDMGDILELFKGIKKFNSRSINCYQFTEDMLKFHGYT